MFDSQWLSWLPLPCSRDDEYEEKAEKSDHDQKLKRRRLVFPVSLYDCHARQLGIDNFHYDAQSTEIRSATSGSRVPLSFVKLISKYEDEFTRKRAKYRRNKIRTTKYTVLSFLPKNLFEQFHRLANFYFLIIIGLNFIPQINAFGKEVSMLPLLCVLTMQAIKDAVEDYSRYVNDKAINQSVIDTFQW